MTKIRVVHKNSRVVLVRNDRNGMVDAKVCLRFSFPFDWRFIVGIWMTVMRNFSSRTEMLLLFGMPAVEEDGSLQSSLVV